MKKEQVDIKKISDNDLVIGCKLNNPIYQQELFRRYYGKLKVVCKRYISDMDEANDLIQDSFIKIYNKLDTYKVQSTLYGWMYRITVNTILDHLRKRKLKYEIVNDIPDVIDGDDYIEDTFSNITPEMIMTCIGKLSPQYRTVFNLYIMEGLSHKEIAAELNICEGTSKSNLYKAKKIFKKKLYTIYKI